MPLNPTTNVWEPEDDSVATRVTGLLSSGSPLLDVAKTDATKTANRRGLLNSSIAAGAGTEAAIRTATPIASQDASQKFQKNISGQTFQQNRALTKDQTDSAERIATASNENRIALGNLDVDSREKIAGLNIQSNDREKAIASSNVVNQVYNDALKSIMGNENLPKATRDAAIAQIQVQRDSQYGLIEQIYRIDLQWAGSSTAAGVNPGVVGTSPAPTTPSTLGTVYGPGATFQTTAPTNVPPPPSAVVTTAPSASAESVVPNAASLGPDLVRIPFGQSQVFGDYKVTRHPAGRNGYGFEVSRVSTGKPVGTQGSFMDLVSTINSLSGGS